MIDMLKPRIAQIGRDALLAELRRQDRAARARLRFVRGERASEFPIALSTRRNNDDARCAINN
jgi:hypothetical protein